MRTAILITALLLKQSVFWGHNKDLKHLRDLYYKAAVNKNNVELFTNFLASSPDVEKTVLSGYMGICYMIRANHSWNPCTKLSFFTKGKNLLDGAIIKDSFNIELRFLRFCVQTNAPGFLRYSQMIGADKAVILCGYSLSKDKDLKDRITNYLVNSNYCTRADKVRLT